MKKLLSVIAGALLFSFTSMAQEPATKTGMKDMRKDIRDVRKDKRQRHEALENGNKAKAKKLTKDIKGDKKDINGDRKNLQSEGVKHPIKRADRQIHAANHHAKKHG